MCITSQQHPRYNLVQEPLGDSFFLAHSQAWAGSTKSCLPAREGFRDKRATTGQSEERLRTPATLPSLPDPNHLPPH